VPVVASRAGGLVDAIDAECTGLLVPPGDPAALTAALLRLLEDASLGERLARAARERVQRHFSVPAMAGAYRRLYADLGTDA
jgi:glycosyltransferase involved in cell wall biosynthesis